MYLKQNRIKDKAYLQSANGRACLICGSRNTTVAHHLRSSELAGTGCKAGDNQVLFLCANHHNEIHKSEQDFCNKYSWAIGKDPIAFAELLYKRYKDTCN